MRLFQLLLLVFFCLPNISLSAQKEKTILIGNVAKQSATGTYIIDSDVDLKGRTLVIPKGKTVLFDGGKIFNGTIQLNKTLLEGDICIDGDIQGSIINNEIKTDWFGFQSGSSKDLTNKLQSIIDLFQSNVSTNSWDINLENPEPTIEIPAGQYNVGEIIIRSYITLKGAGRGSTILRGATFKASQQYNITFEDISIVGYVGATKESKYNLDKKKRSSAFVLNNCARLLFKNVCIKNYDVAFDNYNTYLIDLYSCFISYCNVCFLNDGDGNGLGGHEVHWFGGEMCASVYGFVQKNGNNILINGATVENCKYGFFLIDPNSFNINSCGFEANNYDIYGAIVHVNIENCYFSKSGKKKGDLFIYAPFAIGYTIIQGNTFDLPVYGKPHIEIDKTTELYSNIMIGQNNIVHGGRIPVADQLLPFIIEKGVNSYQTYLPDGKKMLMGQTIVYLNPQTGKYYLVTRNVEGELLFAPFEKSMK